MLTLRARASQAGRMAPCAGLLRQRRAPLSSALAPPPLFECASDDADGLVRAAALFGDAPFVVRGLGAAWPLLAPACPGERARLGLPEEEGAAAPGPPEGPTPATRRRDAEEALALARLRAALEGVTVSVEHGASYLQAELVEVGVSAPSHTTRAVSTPDDSRRRVRQRRLVEFDRRVLAPQGLLPIDAVRVFLLHSPPAFRHAAL